MSDQVGNLNMLSQAEAEAKKIIAHAKEEAKATIKKSIEAAEEEVNIFVQEEQERYKKECDKIVEQINNQLKEREAATEKTIKLIDESASQHIDECVDLLFKAVCNE